MRLQTTALTCTLFQAEVNATRFFKQLIRADQPNSDPRFCGCWLDLVQTIMSLAFDIFAYTSLVGLGSAYGVMDSWSRASPKYKFGLCTKSLGHEQE